MLPSAPDPNTDVTRRVVAQIRDAFSVLERPEGQLSIETWDDEGTHNFFAGKRWEEFDAAGLRRYEAALIYFTPQAFRYYLPAFMLAELTDPDTADIIAENLAFLVIKGPHRAERLASFNKDQLSAIAAFFNCCAARYQDGVYDVKFLQAAEEINKGYMGPC